MSILEELWYGNVKPNENRLPADSEQGKLVSLIVRHEEKLLSLLSEQAMETYEKLRECRSELSSLVECGAFVSGFSLGARIIFEVMGKDGDE